jgi:cytoskeletal protein RodZ
MGIGADLKKAREEAGITLQAVSDKTKINIPFLEAIEREDWSVFPSQTFAKGFLRAYAKVVKVDTVLATRQFNEEVAPTAVVVAPPFNIEAGPIQTAWKFPIPPVVKKETPIPSAPAPKPAPEPLKATAPAPVPPPKVEQRSVNVSKPTSSLRPPSHPKAVPHKASKDLALEFDEAAEAEERKAVANMLFTRPTTSAIESHWRTVVLKALVVVLLLVLVAFGIRGFYRWASSGHTPKPAEAENTILPLPTEAPAPMKPVRHALPPIPPNPGVSATVSVTQKPAVKVPRTTNIKPAPIAKPAGALQPGVTAQSRVVSQPVAQAPVTSVQKTGTAAAQTTGALPAAPAQPTATPATFSVAPAALSQAQAAAQAAAPVDKYHHLILKGLESSWVSVAADGQARVDLYLLPGQLKTFQAVRGFVVKVGNAAGVDAQYDGRSLGVLGGHGRVVDFALPQGYQPSAQH